MNPVIILFALSAMFLVFAVWTWRMPEKKWMVYWVVVLVFCKKR